MTKLLNFQQIVASNTNHISNSLNIGIENYMDSIRMNMQRHTNWRSTDVCLRKCEVESCG